MTLDRLNPPALTRYQLSVLTAVPETEPIDVYTLSRLLHGGVATEIANTRRSLHILELSGLVVGDGESVTRTAEGTAALERHVKRERQGEMF